MRLFVSFIPSSLEYAAPVWDACPIRDGMTLMRIQLSIARAVLKLSRHAQIIRTSVSWRLSAGHHWPAAGVAVALSCCCCGTCFMEVVLLYSMSRFLQLSLLILPILFVTPSQFPCLLATLKLHVTLNHSSFRQFFFLTLCPSLFPPVLPRIPLYKR